MIINPNNEDILTQRDCFGTTKNITLSWSRLSDWTKCKQRSKLLSQGKRTPTTNARNMLAGNVTDHVMRQALELSNKDSYGRLLSLSLDELMDPLPKIWDHTINNPEKNRVYEWKGKPKDDQKNILGKVRKTLKKLHPILEDKLVGKRFVPEFRPKGGMPIIGIPGLEDSVEFIRLFLAVDLAVEVEPNLENPEEIGKWALWDLKTTENDSYLDVTLPQLVFYDLAFTALLGRKPVEWGLIAPLAKDPVRNIYITDEHRRTVLNWIMTYCHSVWSGEEDLTDDDKNCYNCPVMAACPKNIVPLTKDDQGINRVKFGNRLKGNTNDN